MTDAFGVVALVAMTPLIAIQIMGLVYKIKSNNNVAVDSLPVPQADELVYWEEDE